jgi:hypothetical protein
MDMLLRIHAQKRFHWPGPADLELRISGQRPAIGFVWLCFSAVRGAIYFHIPLLQKSLHQFGPAQIGFVFSN